MKGDKIMSRWHRSQGGKTVNYTPKKMNNIEFVLSIIIFILFMAAMGYFIAFSLQYKYNKKVLTNNGINDIIKSSKRERYLK